MKKVRDLILALLGLSFLAFAVSRIGIHNLLQQTNVLRIGLPVIIGLSLLRLVLQTISWKIALRREEIQCSGVQLMLVRLASQGMGYLTVLGPAASEPMKISLLRNHPHSATTATLVDTGVYWLASGVVGIAGCVAAAMALVKGEKSAVPMLVLALVLCGGMVLIGRAKSPLAQLTRALGPRCPKWLVKAADIDLNVRDFARQHPGTIRSMFALDLLCQALLAGEVIAVFWCLHLSLHTTTVLGLEAATRMVKIGAGFMPARIGADESGAAAAFVAFGLPAASGLALALARRMRDLLGCLIGLAWLASTQTSIKPATAPGPLLAEMGK